MKLAELINRMISDKQKLRDKFNWLAVGKFEWECLQNVRNFRQEGDTILLGIWIKETQYDNYYRILDWNSRGFEHDWHSIAWKDTCSF